MSIASTNPGLVAGRGSDIDALDAGAWDAVLRDTTPSPRWLKEQERAYVCAPLGQKGKAKELVETAALIPEYAPEDAAAALRAKLTALMNVVVRGSNKINDKALRVRFQAAVQAAATGKPIPDI
jgi:hypothetical protein